MNTKSLTQYFNRYSEYKNQKSEYNKKLNQMKVGGETQERVDTARVFGFRMVMRRFDLLMMGQKLFFADGLNRLLLGNIKTNSGVITRDRRIGSRRKAH